MDCKKRKVAVVTLLLAPSFILGSSTSGSNVPPAPPLRPNSAANARPPPPRQPPPGFKASTVIAASGSSAATSQKSNEKVVSKDEVDPGKGKEPSHGKPSTSSDAEKSSFFPPPRESKKKILDAAETRAKEFPSIGNTQVENHSKPPPSKNEPLAPIRPDPPGNRPPPPPIRTAVPDNLLNAGARVIDSTMRRRPLEQRASTGGTTTQWLDQLPHRPQQPPPHQQQRRILPQQRQQSQHQLPPRNPNHVHSAAASAYRNGPVVPQQQRRQQQQVPGNGRRPPPPQFRGPGPDNRPGQLVPVQSRPPPRRQQQQQPAWKRVWRGIEKGLDSLADLEDTVAGRAAQLVQDVKVPKKLPSSLGNLLSRPQLPLSRNSANRPSPTRPSSGAEPEQQTNLDGIEGLMQRKMAASRFDKKPSSNEQKSESENTPNGRSTTTTIPGNPYTAGKMKQWNHDTRRIIRANGGALSTGPEAPVQTEEAPGATAPNNSPSSTTEQKQKQPPAYNSNRPPLSTAAPQPAADGRKDARAFLNSQTTSFQRQSTGPRPAQRPLSQQFGDDDDDDPVPFTKRIGGVFHRLPKLRFRLPRRQPSYASSGAHWDDDDEDEDINKPVFFGLWRRKQAASIPSSVSSTRFSRKKKTDTIPPPIAKLLSRYDDERPASLLGFEAEHQSASIGRSQGISDVTRLFLVLAGVHLLPDLSAIALPTSVVAVIHETIPSLLESISAGLQTWSPFAFVAAILLGFTANLVLDERLRKLADDSGEEVESEVQYGSMYLRLFSSEVTSPRLAPVAGNAAKGQIFAQAQSSRATAFVYSLLASLVLMSVPFVRPLCVAVVESVKEIALANVFRERPLEWELVGAKILSVLGGLGSTLSSLVLNDFVSAMDDPVKVAFKCSLFLALCAVILVPALETNRTIHPVELIDEEEIEAVAHEKLTGHVSDMGASGANRLTLLSVDHSMETLLERWRKSAPAALSGLTGISVRSFGRLVVYGCFVGALLVVPLLIYGSSGAMQTFCPTGSAAAICWDSLFDLTIVLLFAYKLSWSALNQIVRSEDLKQYVVGFLGSVKKAADERAAALGGNTVDLQLQAAISPAAGLVVKDLWAAHTTKRAWAVRGAGLHCKNGEVLAVLGDSGSGKTRLFVALAEAIFQAPKAALSATRVRGAISMGGVDISKWDNSQLRKRFGLMLKDVRMVADAARVSSGRTLEEILEPSNGLHTLDPTHSPGPNERSCVLLALKLTGLYTSLLPRLPSKMSSIVTCQEDDLKPSPLRPRYHVLSPTEWSKLFLAKILAQAIYDNENSAGTNEAMEQSLMGSVLLLDDPASHLSEVEEMRLLADLRKTGAATVLSSNRWATGRYADRIVVLKDGAVVESGTHEELLSRGPQQSLYAAQWHAMTNQ